jgi:hypothetical protein
MKYPLLIKRGYFTDIRSSPHRKNFEVCPAASRESQFLSLIFHSDCDQPRSEVSAERVLGPVCGSESPGYGSEKLLRSDRNVAPLSGF